MDETVTDTNALIWHLTASPRLTPAARARFERADRGESRIYIPIICLVELIYLSERGRIPTAMLANALALIKTPGASYALADLNAIVLQNLPNVPRDAVPDMPDRIITATAFAFGLPLMTSDGAIQKSGVVPIVW